VTRVAFKVEKFKVQGCFLYFYFIVPSSFRACLPHGQVCDDVIVLVLVLFLGSYFQNQDSLVYFLP
ncbi:hypothetical protein, partial [Zunongwangia profunda]|uniref:hypothetical protein n=1 Tax=Zunongwangia profunda TaxID=398743 RepID=UPI0030D79077